MEKRPRPLATTGLLHFFFSLIAFTLCAALLSTVAHAAEGDKSVAEQLVDTMEQLAGGRRPGFRSNHAKGIVVSGSFAPSDTAATLSKAAHLRGKSVPVTVRFSNPGGNPAIPDNSPKANPRGMAIRFHLPDAGFTDVVVNSVNRFAAATPEEFLSFLQAVAASAGGTVKPSPLEQFLASHPKTAAFVQTPKPAPASFATSPFFGVNAFEFTNAQGVSRYGRYRITPMAGERYLSDTEVKAAGPNYLMDELPTRIERGPVSFRIAVQIAAPGDPITDATEVWPADRPEIELGVLTLDKVVPDGRQTERALAFNPLNLTDGIAPTDDPILQARPVAYAISVSRRAGE